MVISLPRGADATQTADTDHNSELCCMTYSEWVCEREREIAFPS